MKKDAAYFIQLAIYFPNNALSYSEEEKRQAEDWLIQTLEIKREDLSFLTLETECSLRPSRKDRLKYPLVDCLMLEAESSTEPLDSQVKGLLQKLTDNIDRWKEVHKDLESFLWIEARPQWRVYPILELDTLRMLTERSIRLVFIACDHEVGRHSRQYYEQRR